MLYEVITNQTNIGEVEAAAWVAVAVPLVEAVGEDTKGFRDSDCH